MKDKWKQVILKDVCCKTSQWNPRYDERNAFYYVDVSSVSNDTFSITAPVLINVNDAPGRARKIIYEKDVIYATIRPTLCRIALVPEQYDNNIASTAFCIVRANRKLAIPEFLFFLLLSDGLSKSIADLQHGASYPAVTDKDILNQPISLPALPEQEKIAAVLLNLQNAISIQEKIIQSLRDLKNSTMNFVFSCGLRGEKTKSTPIGGIPESWVVKKIGDIAEISAGGTPSRERPEYWNGSIPWVKTAELGYCTIKDTDEKITELGLKSSSAKLLPSGSLLMAMYGQGITRGKVAILGIEAATNQACAAIIPKNDKIKTKFLYHIFTWSYERIRALGHGAQQPNLNAKIIADFPVPFPKDYEQDGIIKLLDSLDKKLESHSVKKSALQDLFKTTLNKLMTGEIRVGDFEIDVKDVRT